MCVYMYVYPSSCIYSKYTVIYYYSITKDITRSLKGFHQKIKNMTKQRTW